MSEGQDTQAVQRPGKRRTGLILAVALVAVVLIVVLVRSFTHQSPAHGAAPQVVTEPGRVNADAAKTQAAKPKAKRPRDS